MSDHVVPYFHNSDGVSRIEIGAKEFMCVGAKPPFDHPHIFLDMGDDNDKVCPYCSTHFVYNNSLGSKESIPSDCTYLVDAA